jgi:hypothetical protein
VNQYVNAIAGRLSLRTPQRRSPEILDRITEIVPPNKGADIAAADVAVNWCERASTHAKTYDGKPWTYLLVPRDAIAENMTLKGLAERVASS